MADPKLVRDRIPDRIRANGETPRTRVVHGDEKLECLKAKLIEEAKEASESQKIESLAEELADVLEVVDGLCSHVGIDIDEVKRVQRRKRAERGGFERGIILEGVDA